MDLLQLVFGFVNAPLFATFLLGMFWKRTTGHGAFSGLLSGTVAAALDPRPAPWPKGKGGWIGRVHTFPSTMAQNFWIAIFAWTACFVVTIVVSLVTTPASGAGTGRAGLRPDRSSADVGVSWYLRPGPLAIVVVIALLLVLNIWFCLTCSICDIPRAGSSHWLGVILVVIGDIRSPGCARPCTDVNVNLYSGLLMLAFGLFLLRGLARPAHPS